MKKTYLTLLAVGLSSVAQAQVIGKYEFHGHDQDGFGGLDTNPQNAESLEATYVADHCISLSAITPVTKSTPYPRSWSTATYDSSTTTRPTSAGNNGLSGNHADCFSGWSSNYSDDRTLSFEVTYSNSAQGSLSGISFDIGNYGFSSDPDRYRLKVYRNGSLIYQAENSITRNWSSKTHDLASSVSAADLASKAGETTTFKVTLGAYGPNATNYGMIAMDNIQILGKHECVPEPSSALLLGLGAMLTAMRRRR